MPIQVPANYPLSPDIEDRRQQTQAPLMGQLGSALDSFMYRAKLAGPELYDATFNTGPKNFYVPGQDASSLGTQIQPAVLNSKAIPAPRLR